MREMGRGMGGPRRATWPDLDVWLIGAELPGEPTAPRPTVDDALRARGADLYARDCAMCHGTRGDGKGPLAAMLATPPQDFSAAVYKLRTTPHESLPTDDDLFRTISRGIHGTSMIPWTNLSEADRWALVAELKTFSTEFADEPAASPISVSEPPVATPALLARGRFLFESAGCASCHGPHGKGDGPAAAMLRDTAGRPVRPTDLTGHRYRRGALTPEIYVTLRTGLDGTPMASFASTLSVDDTWAVATYVHSIAPGYVVTAGGVACPEIANLDPWELQGARMATMPMRAHMARRMGW
jgi:cytochrome c oxidase cbb3-type subunit 2